MDSLLAPLYVLAYRQPSVCAVTVGSCRAERRTYLAPMIVSTAMVGGPALGAMSPRLTTAAAAAAVAGESYAGLRLRISSCSAPREVLAWRLGRWEILLQHGPRRRVRQTAELIVVLVAH